MKSAYFTTAINSTNRFAVAFTVLKLTGIINWHWYNLPSVEDYQVDDFYKEWDRRLKDIQEQLKEFDSKAYFQDCPEYKIEEIDLDPED